MDTILNIYIKIVRTGIKCKYFIFHCFKIKIGQYSDLHDKTRIGFIDQDGLIHVSDEFLRYFNPNDLYTGGEFLQRKRFELNVLIDNGLVLIEKNFSNNYVAFYNEIAIINKLRNYTFVPKIHFVDYKKQSITINYLDGFVLREKIAKLNCKIRDIDRLLDTNELSDKTDPDPAIIVKDIVSRKLFDDILENVRKIHQKKILVRDIKYGNIIIKDEESFLIDFHDAIFFKYTPKFIFDIIKKSDLLIIQSIFGY